MYKKTVLLDLDGVLNKYNGEYDKNYIPEIREGAKDFVETLSKNFEIKIFTTRNVLLTAKWLIENRLDKYILDITKVKEPAYIIIDDRGITFNGDYNEVLEIVKNFKPWYYKT